MHFHFCFPPVEATTCPPCIIPINFFCSKLDGPVFFVNCITSTSFTRVRRKTDSIHQLQLQVMNHTAHHGNHQEWKEVYLPFFFSAGSIVYESNVERGLTSLFHSSNRRHSPSIIIVYASFMLLNGLLTILPRVHFLPYLCLYCHSIHKGCLHFSAFLSMFSLIQIVFFNVKFLT
jgi:hypothetical protein